MLVCLVVCVCVGGCVETKGNFGHTHMFMQTKGDRGEHSVGDMTPNNIVNAKRKHTKQTVGVRTLEAGGGGVAGWWGRGMWVEAVYICV